MTTVRELIKELEEYDADCQVLVSVQDGDIYNHIRLDSLSRANPIIHVAKESMMAFVNVPSVNIKPNLSPSFNNEHSTSVGTITLAHEEVIGNIMKSNERKMKKRYKE